MCVCVSLFFVCIYILHIHNDRWKISAMSSRPQPISFRRLNTYNTCRNIYRAANDVCTFLNDRTSIGQACVRFAWRARARRIDTDTELCNCHRVCVYLGLCVVFNLFVNMYIMIT